MLLIFPVAMLAWMLLGARFQVGRWVVATRWNDAAEWKDGYIRDPLGLGSSVWTQRGPLVVLSFGTGDSTDRGQEKLLFLGDYAYSMACYHLAPEPTRER